MRIEAGDPGAAHVKRVLLDGEEIPLRQCIAADPLLGYVEVFVLDVEGHYVIDHEAYGGPCPKQETRRGKVEVWVDVAAWCLLHPMSDA